MVSLLLTLRMLAGRVGEADAGSVQEAAESAGRLLEELRRLARGIHPAVVADSGLAGALGDLAEHSTDMPIDVRVPGDLGLSALAQSTAYEFVGTAVADARAAAATSLAVKATRSGGNVRLQIDHDAVRSPETSDLDGVAVQAEALAGSVRIHGVPGDGAVHGAVMRVVIADDAALVRAGLSAMLADGGVEVVAEATDAGSLVQAVAGQRPDAAVVDIRMPPTHTDEGIVAAGRIRLLHPEVAVLVLSQAMDTSYALRLLEENPTSVGYLLKERIAEPATLVDSLRRVVAGECVVDTSIVSRLLSRARRQGPLDTLSPREREVLALMAEGRSNSGIGQALFLSERTVETHVSRVFDKLGLLDVPTSGNRRVLAVLTYLRAGPRDEGKP